MLFFNFFFSIKSGECNTLCLYRVIHTPPNLSCQSSKLTWQLDLLACFKYYVRKLAKSKLSHVCNPFELFSYLSWLSQGLELQSCSKYQCWISYWKFWSLLLYQDGYHHIVDGDQEQSLWALMFSKELSLFFSASLCYDNGNHSLLQ